MLTKNVKQPVPAVDFANSIAFVDGLFNQEQNMACHAHRVFKYRELFTNTKQAHDKERDKSMAGWAKHEILAAAAEFCTMVRHHQLWRSTGHLLSSDVPL